MANLLHPSNPRAVILALLSLITTVRALPPWGAPYMQPGIAAVTCAAPTSGPPPLWTPLAQTATYSFGIMDLRTPPGASYASTTYPGMIWSAPCYHDPAWNVKDLGGVYGIALKPDGEIYLGAHGLYAASTLGVYNRYGDIGGGASSLLAAGTIYRINQTTGAPTVFAVIPGQQNMALNGNISGPGLGNLKYDSLNNQFFVTSLEDGKIYRVSGAGAVINSHDPFSPDTGAPGMPPYGNRVWGIAVRGSTVYYGTWNLNKAPANQNQIRKVDLNGSGDFIPTSDALLLTLPISDGTWQLESLAVADLSFSKDGSLMLAGERTMYTETQSYNHQSRVHRINTSTWSINSSLKTGNNTGFNGGEAYGGVTWGQEGGVDEQIIWMTSADMIETSWGNNSVGPHGVFGVRPPDFPPAGPSAFTPNAFVVPFIPGTNADGPDNKGSGGDIEIMQQSRDCEVKVKSIRCPEKHGDPYTVTLTISNFSPKTAQYVVLSPCPAADLPPGATTVQPAPAFTTLTPPLTTGNSTTLNITLPVPATGGKVCFIVTLLDATGNDCCTEKICVDLPRCDCAELIKQDIACVLQADGTFKYLVTLTVKNRTNASLTPYAFHNVVVLPSPTLNPDINPANVTAITLVPDPIPPGATGTVTFCYTGPPGPAYANIVFHDERYDQCCALEDICFDFPVCGDAAKPDECKVTEHVACTQTPGVPGGTATITYTICNNGASPKTYNWNAAGVSPSACPKTLTAASFTPSSGTIGPVGPGLCATVSITVSCLGFVPGDCAEFQVCARETGPVPVMPVCCRGDVYRPGPAGFAVTIVPPSPIPAVGPGARVPVTLRVENTGTAAMPVELHIADSEGLLLFATDAATPGTPFLTLNFVVAGGDSREVTLMVSRTSASTYFPNFTSLLVAAVSGGRSVAALSAPVQLTRSTAPPGPGGAIRNVRFQPAPIAVILDVQTGAGQHYQIQQTATLATGPWVNAPCITAGPFILPDGSFRGTGGIVSCTLPCDTATVRKFYRVALLQE